MFGNLGCVVVFVVVFYLEGGVKPLRWSLGIISGERLQHYIIFGIWSSFSGHACQNIYSNYYRSVMWSCTNDPLGGARCGFQNSRTESHAARNTLYTDDISGNMKVCGNHYTVSETRIYFVSGMYCTYSYGETCSIHELAINNSPFTHVAPMKGSNQDFNIKWSGLLGTMGDILYSI